MTLLPLDPGITEEGKAALELDLLLKDLSTRGLPAASVNYLNTKSEGINKSFREGTLTRKQLLLAKSDILNYLEKNNGLVPANYYTNMWLPLVISCFGLPFGVIAFVILENSAFIGIGLPIGLMIGSFYGSHLDKKAEKEGKVLNFTQQ